MLEEDEEEEVCVCRRCVGGGQGQVEARTGMGMAEGIVFSSGVFDRCNMFEMFIRRK